MNEDFLFLRETIAALVKNSGRKVQIFSVSQQVIVNQGVVSSWGYICILPGLPAIKADTITGITTSVGLALAREKQFSRDLSEGEMISDSLCSMFQ
jgi:hypothetical protein